MAIRAVIFDIGGILEVTPRGDEPTTVLPRMVAAWEAHLGMLPGELETRIAELDTRLKSVGKDGALGTCTEAEWLAELRRATGMDQTQLDAFMRDFWDVYLGQLNAELAAYFAALRPRYRTALLSNSFIGARREERERYHFEAIADLIVYSHEAGIAKPDPRIFTLTCARLGVLPAEAVFLDDAEQHVVAARALGMHAILYHDTAQAMADLNSCLEASER